MKQPIDEAYLNHLGKMQRPIPGSSLTNDPNNPLPFEGPPEFTKRSDALEEIFTNMIREDVYPQLLEALLQGTTVMEMVQVILMEGFRQGKWNPDLFLILIEPTAYIIMALAERAEVDFIIDREPDEPSDEEIDSEIQEKFERISKKVGSKSKPGMIPKEIQEKIETLPTPDESQEEPMVEEESLLARPRG